MECNDFTDECGTSSQSDVVDGCPVIVDETGLPCGETSGLEILDEFRDLYKKRIQNIDDNENSAEERIEVMTDWIRDLDEQNTMLVKTVKELEIAASCRVKILENKLRETSEILSDNMTQVGKPSQETLNELSERIDVLESEERELKQKIEYLNADIRGLMELIKRGSMENRWSLDGIKFYSIRETDIQIPTSWSCGQARDDEKNTGNMKNKSIEYEMELHDRLADFNKKLQTKEEKIQRYKYKFEVLRDRLNKQRELCNCDDDDNIIRMLDIVDSELNEDDDSAEESCQDGVGFLRNQVDEKTKEIRELKERLRDLEKDARESQVALAQEVADKHDQIILLKDKLTKLEDIYHRTTIQLNFKDELLKKIRKEQVNLDKNEKDCLSSSRNSHVSRSSEEEHQEDSVLSSLSKIKSSMESENNSLMNLKHELFSVFDVLNKASTVDPGTEEFITNVSKLSKTIDNLSLICLEKTKSIIQLELTLQEIRESKNNLQQSELPASQITREQFNILAEYRLCTVEAQAATEDLKDETEEITENLKSRHQFFLNLSKTLKNFQELLFKNSSNLSKTKNNLEIQHDEKLMTKKTIIDRNNKLKNIKNQINELILEQSSSSVSSSDENHCDKVKKDLSDDEKCNCDNLFDKAAEEIDYIICNLNIFMTKEAESLLISDEIGTQLADVNENLTDLGRKIEGFLEESGKAEREVEGRFKRVNKLEEELDDAHTRMQENLENIISMSQQNESNNHDDHSTSSRNTSDENSPTQIIIKQLKNSLSSKDQLVKHQEEVIRLHKTSIQMAEEALESRHGRLQAKINEQVLVINRYLEEKKNLLKQSQLQNQTIRHLQDAVVDAKKSLVKSPGHKDNKSTIDLTVGDVWASKTPAVFNNGDIHDI